MREQQNPSTPELHQPLLFAPSELLACGTRITIHSSASALMTAFGPGARRRRRRGSIPWSSGHARPPATARSFSTAIRESVKNSRVRSRRATAIYRGPTFRRSARRRGICISAGTCGHPCTAARCRDRGHSRHSAALRSTTWSRSARTVAMWASWRTTRSTAITRPSIRALSPTTWRSWLKLYRPTGDGRRSLRTSPRPQAGIARCSRRSANWHWAARTRAC